MIYGVINILGDTFVWIGVFPKYFNWLGLGLEGVGEVTLSRAEFLKAETHGHTRPQNFSKSCRILVVECKRRQNFLLIFLGE